MVPGRGAGFWSNLAIRQFVDANIVTKRKHSKELGLATHRHFGLCEFEQDEIYFEDMMYFVTKGLKYKYVYKIFLDLKKGMARDLPATNYRGVDGANQYTASGSISLYDHIVRTSKSVFQLGGYTTTQLRNAALLALIHDMGKMADALRASNAALIISGSHEEDSSKYAALLMTDPDDAELLELFQDCLLNKNPERRRHKGSSPCHILKLVDFQDRKKTETEIFEKEMMPHDS